MNTIKLVVIGSSGVGKTSLRGKVGVFVQISSLGCVYDYLNLTFSSTSLATFRQATGQPLVQTLSQKRCPTQMTLLKQ